MPDQLVLPLPSKFRLALSGTEAENHELGLTIACPYEPCAAPAGTQCRRKTIDGKLCETRLLHIVRIATERREREAREKAAAADSGIATPTNRARARRSSARTRAAGSRRPVLSGSRIQSRQRHRRTTVTISVPRTRRPLRRPSRGRAGRPTRQRNP